MARQYQFKIEDVTYHWDEQFITGAEVRQQGPGIPEDIAEAGIEKFYAQDASSEAGNS